MQRGFRRSRAAQRTCNESLSIAFLVFRPAHRSRGSTAPPRSSNPDLSAFFAHGGKLILRENMADLAQGPLAGIDYFDPVVVKLG